MVLPEGFSIENSSTLGIELIRGLAFQLDGKVSWMSDQGTICTLTIPYPKIEVGDETSS